MSRLVVVAGPTGTGKSELALDLAERLDGEVINADSMQLYRGMDIGTAKLPPAERRGVPHHLLDVLEVTQTATVAAYQRDAGALVQDILARGRTPLLVGGSGLYIRAVVDSIEFPATDPAVRSRLEDELAVLGPAALAERLREVDPDAALSIGPANGRKIVRALEVIELTGRPFSATMPRYGAPAFDAVQLLLDRETAGLDVRLADRVQRMVELGLLDEVRQLATRGLRQGVTASRALGYAQFLAVLDGTSTVPDAIAQTTQATRRFVRRQRSWFRRDHRMIEVAADRADLLDRALEAIAATSVS
ncbi:tRNA (adenosine(37)-N6)-dimethylallyltransferase MiaA [Nakamurella multipartita]|uniref:tRNA dimethylallyltransferase n=1 Tax=Nakamurella multipartita (strain ATCC 700099 / DSM 44233 / CIP 104796 / JCM 9543 / NBRC 105858 / Y-104) TaxID=479431 RepID=C8XHH2_NAKMY|nr:tRNA (adenosine(37)-N6)-dimethylallyltransferase MiaA [Nakamurella multipartita]ACV80275.1 tRNA delta(2)-isopentenylpyrophosphate transferase [Nakamurella multipartita DSM 44233]